MLATRVHRLVLATLILVSFVQRPGQTTFDTKFDLTADPGGFLTRALRLWNPEQNFGELQNQAYGYFFPQGSFFWLCHVLTVPEWVSQRMWSALMLVVAYEGLRRVHRVVVPDAPLLSVVAGLAYVTAPRLLGLSGVLTGEILPTAVLPWALLPLVLARAGQMRPRSAGLLCGVALLFYGGLNAVENLATYPLLAIVVLTGVRKPGGWQLARWWALGTTLASLWWFLPLLVLGRYSPPFLDYIETAAATTRPLGWSNALRGADHWLAFVFVGGRPWWPGASDLALDPVLIVVTAVVAAVSLVGLLHRQMPARTPLLLSAGLGLVLLTVAHDGVGSSLIDLQMRALLDTVLAPLRNVHKVDPLIRLPLALGFAHAVGLAMARLRANSDLSTRAPLVPLLLAFALLAGAATPAFTDRLRRPGWEQVPAAWTQASEFLAAEAVAAQGGEESGGIALVLPGSGFGQQYWGWTIDEPMQGVASTPWASRSQVPLVPGATLRFLDSIEERIEDGIGSPSLAPTLAQAGVSHLVVRRDLDLAASEPPPPARVDAALAASPGLELAASFGNAGFAGQSTVDIYRLVPPTRLVSAPLVTTLARTAGGPEDLLTARELGLIGPSQSSIFDAESPQIVGDGFRRVERQFGRLRDALSAVLTQDEAYRLERAAHDHAGLPGQKRVFARFRGIEKVTASSSGGYADTLGPVRAELGPASAVDQDLATSWQSVPLLPALGQWIEVDLGEARPITDIEVTADVSRFGTRAIRRLEVSAGGQTQLVGVDPNNGVAQLRLDGTAVAKVRFTVAAVSGPVDASAQDDEGETDPINEDSGAVAIREIVFDGFDVERELVVTTPLSADTALTVRSRAGRRPCLVGALGASCDLYDARPRLEQLRLERSFTVAERGKWEGRGTVVARPTPDAAALLQPLAPAAEVQASSVLGEDPLVSGRFAFDSDLDTSWRAAAGVEDPELRLALAKPRTVDRIRVTPAGGNTVGPRAVRITNEKGQSRRVKLGSEDFGFFKPLKAQTLRLQFRPSAAVKTEGEPAAGLGLAEVVLDGLTKQAARVDPAQRTGAVCGLGPEVVIDGEARATEVVGTVDDVLRGTTMQWKVCDGPVALSPGEHQLQIIATGAFSAEQFTLAPSEGDSRVLNPEKRTTRVVAQDAVSSTIDIASGGAAVLRLARNVNEGWEARLDGQPLEPVSVDGWQQGFWVPGGQGGTIDVSFSPDRTYRLSLLVGLMLALLLVGAAAWSWNRDRRSGRPDSEAAGGLGPQSGREAPLAPVGGRPFGQVERGRRKVLARAAVMLALPAVLILAGPFAALGATGAVASAWLTARGATSMVRTEQYLTALVGLLVVGGSLVHAAGWGASVGQAAPAADILAGCAFGIACVVAVLGSRATGDVMRAS